MFHGLTASIAYIGSGKLRPLAVTLRHARRCSGLAHSVPDYESDIRVGSAQRYSHRNRRSPQRPNQCCASRVSNHLSDCSWAPRCLPVRLRTSGRRLQKRSRSGPGLSNSPARNRNDPIYTTSLDGTFRPFSNVRHSVGVGANRTSR